MFGTYSSEAVPVLPQIVGGLIHGMAKGIGGEVREDDRRGFSTRLTHHGIICNSYVLI
jgi:hypothetical protein